MEKPARARIQFAVILILSVIWLGCSTQPKEIAVTDPMSDTLVYGEKEYDMMRAFVLKDTAVMQELRELVDSENEDAIVFDKMLHTSYDQRFTVGLSDQDIDDIMRSYFVSMQVIGKFDSIEATLNSDSMKANRLKIDSLMKALEDSKKALEDLTR